MTAQPRRTSDVCAHHEVLELFKSIVLKPPTNLDTKRRIRRRVGKDGAPRSAQPKSAYGVSGSLQMMDAFRNRRSNTCPLRAVSFSAAYDKWNLFGGTTLDTGLYHGQPVLASLGSTASQPLASDKVLRWSLVRFIPLFKTRLRVPLDTTCPPHRLISHPKTHRPHRLCLMEVIAYVPVRAPAAGGAGVYNGPLSLNSQIDK